MSVYSLLAFPLGEQRQENHQIDGGLFVEEQGWEKAMWLGHKRHEP